MDKSKLTQQPGCPAVSIYLSTHKRWVNTQEDKIRLKNILKKVEKSIKSCKEILNPIQSLLIDEEFWKAQKGGLALFVGKDIFEYQITSKKYKEQYFITDDFELSPLESGMTDLPSHYILLLSPKRVELYLAENAELTRLGEQVLPSSAEEVWAIDNPEKSIQYYTTTPAVAGGTVFHGHGAVPDHKDIRMRNFINYVDNKIIEVINDKSRPLVLACVEDLWHMYSETTSYPNIATDFISGSPDNLKHHDLVRESLKVFSK